MIGLILTGHDRCLRNMSGSRRFVLLLIFLLLWPMLLPVFCSATEEENSASVAADIQMESGSFAEDETVTADFYDSNADKTYCFSIPYSDAFFTRDPDVFYMDFAQASYGLTVSAFRSSKDENTPEDQNARTFFEQIGFENFQSDWFDEDPSTDSISSVMASKTIANATVIAFVCNGANYGDEWAGNLTVGSGSEHEGFSGAASICEDRLTAYIEEHEISGEVILWIAGYSRAAAVGNCLAARMIESGLFSNIYGYFLCTPNTTRNPVAYSNLFNIIGQNDIVPQVPASCWGYGRNGVDLYLPAQESNYNYYEAFLSADEIYSENRKESFHNNPALNWQIYVVKEFLCAIFPTAEEYTEKLQPELLSVFEADNTLDIFSAVKEALGRIDDFTAEQQQGVDALTEYLDMVIYEYISGNYTQILDGSWSEEDSLAQNLIFEHMAIVYGSWLFSTENPSVLFEENTKTVHLVIQGDFDMEVWDNYGLVQSVSEGNEETVYEPGSGSRAANADEVYLYATNHDGSAVISIPADREFTLKLYPKKTAIITMFSDIHSYESTSAASDIMLFRVEKEQCIILSDLFELNGLRVCTETGSNLNVLRNHLPEGILSLVAREKLANGSYTVGQVLFTIAVFLFIPLILLLTAIVSCCLGRRIHRKKPGTVVTVCSCLLVPVFAAGAFAFRKLLPNIPALAIAYAAIAAFSALFLILRWARVFKVKKKEQ